MKTPFSKHLRSGPGVSHYPNGSAFYQSCIDFHTTQEGMTAQEIHDIGLAEVARLWAGVDEIAQKIGANMTGREFMAALRYSVQHL